MTLSRQMRTSPVFRATSAAAAAAESDPITITGDNIPLTPALTDYINTKLSRALSKVTGPNSPARCDVHLVVAKNPRVNDGQKCEITTFVKGSVMRSVSSSPDMYNSIDQVSDQMLRKLKKYKNRRLDGWHGGGGAGTNFAAEFGELAAQVEEEDQVQEEEYVDEEKPTITKIKSFDLGKPISIDEAIFALDYIDHDFYVFRDEASDEISVVYKRNTGGVGLIQPTQEN